MRTTKFFATVVSAVIVFSATSCVKDEATPLSYEREHSDLVSFGDNPVIEDSYVVVLRDELSLPDAELEQRAAGVDIYAPEQQLPVYRLAVSMLQEHGIDAEVERVWGSALRGFSFRVKSGDLASLAGDARVSLFEQDRVVSLSAKGGKGGGGNGGGGKGGGGKGGGGGVQQPPQTVPAGITRVGGPGDGTGKTAWIVDSGIEMAHPDLNTDASRSYSFIKGNKKNYNDQHGHGTHVAGTVGAINNEIGVVGVAANATLVAVRVLDGSGNGSYSGAISGVDYVAANASAGDVANLSLEAAAYEPLDLAVEGAAASGVIFVLAAGNSATDAANISPARANGANIYTVSAMDSNDNWAAFSNYGNPPVDYAAPGVSVYSTHIGSGYTHKSGTSMAAPHVAGILLLGNITTDGNVLNDPDGTPDPIAHQ